MAKHQKRKQRKKEKPEVVEKNISERGWLLPLSSEDRKSFSHLVIGKAKCNECNELIHVQNDSGLEGAPNWDYFVNHFQVNSKSFCFGSEKRLQQAS